MKKTWIAALGFAFCGAAAMAQGQPNINRLISDTIGYVNVSPGVVIMEGEDFGTWICRFDLTDEDFSAWTPNSSLPGDKDHVTCIPVEELRQAR
jgi:hypothetical protein